MPDTYETIQGHLVPFVGTEENRALSAPGRKTHELHLTTQNRLFLQDIFIAGNYWHGAVADEAAMLALSTSTNGCRPGDWCTHDGSKWRCISNQGELLTDWEEFGSGGGGGTMTAAAIRDALETLTLTDRLNATALQNLGPTARDALGALSGTDRLSASAIKDLGTNARDALAALTGADRLSYSSLKDTPSAYSLPTASASVLGGVKVGTGLSIDGSGILSVTLSVIGVLIVLPWISVDSLEGSTVGDTVASSGLSWAGNGSAVELIKWYVDDLESLTVGDTSVTGGTGMTGSNTTGEILLFARDDMESYAVGATTLNAGLFFAAAATTGAI